MNILQQIIGTILAITTLTGPATLPICIYLLYKINKKNKKIEELTERLINENKKAI